jgi:hypothetical protein
LVPVEHLVNGVSIVQCEAVERVAYFHVELHSHDVIVADGRDLCRLRQPADVPQRRRVRRSLSRRGCAALGLLRAAPRRRPKVEAVWRRLALRAGITVATGPLQGWLDAAEAGLVRGWARDAANSDMPVPVEVVVDGIVLGSTLANHYRADLATAGYGHGRHGFECRFPAPVASDRPHMLVARRATDRAPLTRAPRLLPSAAARVRGAA